ncbi:MULTISPECIES: glutaredoxin 3 [Microbulbifer]|uniref:glutaredoxin 3 n=1 Tax=Microbulbifer TaxID=48073 RepID=UPI001E59C805|nr:MULTISPECIES: glutaredoxin 3 [Microbulbifer]UHQ53683.1 glutaredoxin 3 [Microbulbifer sp. YPW16]
MQEVTIYTTRFCPFCVRAKYLLDRKQVPYREIPVDGNPQKRAEMTARAGARTVPQIWVGDEHVGGCDELMAAERSGELDRLLRA